MEEEVWATIPGFSYYQVSNYGRVQNVRNGGLLNPGHKRGMWVVSFRDDHGHQTTHNLGHWVLLAFVGPRPDGHVASHLDGDHGNNYVGNLVWETYLEN